MSPTLRLGLEGAIRAASKRAEHCGTDRAGVPAGVVKPGSTALISDTTEVDIYIGQEYRIDVCSESGHQVRAEHHGLPRRGGIRLQRRALHPHGPGPKVIGI